MTDVLCFDLNGTLLDLSALDPHFVGRFGSALARERWFEQTQALWLTDNSTGTYHPFATHADAALAMLAEKEGVDLTAGDRKIVVDRLTTLPPFPDVAAGLARLMAKGHRLAALTNGAHKSAVAQLAFAGLNGFFGDDVYSVESVKRYKPAAEPYAFVAEQMSVKPAAVTLVAAHGWDTAGAAAAGMKTAFLRRPRQVLSPAGPTPDVVAADLNDLATQWDA